MIRNRSKLNARLFDKRTLQMKTDGPTDVRSKLVVPYFWAAVGLIGAVIFIGGDLLWNDLFGTSVDGSIRAAGSQVGSWAFTPDICESGFRRSFYGVRMFSSHNDQMAFVYVDDPTRGRSIEVKVPEKDYGYRFYEQDCRVLDASLQTGSLVNYVRAISGTINLDCQTQGGSLKGSLKFVNCH
jgi:hypothetical protein